MDIGKQFVLRIMKEIFSKLKDLQVSTFNFI